MLYIHWLIPYKESDINIIFNTNVASIRLRLGIFANNIDSKKIKLTFGDNVKNNPDIIVIGKPGNSIDNKRIELWLNQIRHFKKNHSKIFLDYTDHHLIKSFNESQNSSMSYFYNHVIEYIDKSIVSSKFLKKELTKYFNGEIIVIPDAIEIEVTPPTNKKNSTTKILWFGHSSNIKYLREFIVKWPILDFETEVYVLTNEDGFAFLNQNPIPIIKNLSIQFGLWSKSSMISVARICDLAIIPSDLSNFKKAGASSNRLITCLALGLPTAADKLDSYNEFEDYFIDIRSSRFIDLLQNPIVFHKNVLEAQNKVIPLFKPNKIANKWISALID